VRTRSQVIDLTRRQVPRKRRLPLVLELAIVEIHGVIAARKDELTQELMLDPLDDRMARAMVRARSMMIFDPKSKHALPLDEQTRFRAAVGALLMDATDEERAWLEQQLAVMAARQQVAAGGKIDVGQISAMKEILLQTAWEATRNL
jgi:hypothetical protein